MSALLNDARRRAGRTQQSQQRGPAQRRPPMFTPEQSRMLVRLGFRTPGVLIAGLAALVLVTLVSVNSDLTGTFGAIAGLWFAVHLVPLSISGTSLGVFPLLPTLVLIVVVARGVSRCVTADANRRDLGAIAGAAVLGPILVTAVALAVAADASAVIGLVSPHAIIAFAWVAGVHGVAAGLGLAMGSWDAICRSQRVPDWINDVVRPTIRAAMVLVAGGGAIVLAAMVASWSTLEMLLGAGNGFVGVLGLTVLSILFLPNVILGALAVSVGSAAQIGDAAVSVFSTTPGPLPALPVLAVLPEGAAQPTWFLMLVVPLSAGVLLGRDCAHRSVDVHYALSSVWLGAAAIGIVAGLCGYSAGGNLGTFGTVEVTVWSFGLLMFAWLAVVGSAAAAVTVWRGGSKTEPSPVTLPAPVPSTESEPAEDPTILPPPVVHEDRALEAEIVEVPEALPSVNPDVEVEVAAPDETPPPLDAEVVETTSAETAEDLPDKAAGGSD